MSALMQCGHSAQGKDSDGKPVCVICYGIKPGATEAATAQPDLSGRLAKCGCGVTRPSSIGLAFFEHRPNRQTDAFYCGCRGWD